MTIRFKRGELRYVKTPAGPIVRVTVLEETNGGFSGTVDAGDDWKLVESGVPSCTPDFVSFFHTGLLSNKDDFDEDHRKWESIKNQQKVQKKGVLRRNRD